VCGHTGYQARTGIFALLSVDETLRGLIHNRASELDLHRQAQRNGLGSLREDGERLVALGLTSREELLRVTRD
jgi:general secretion pathway protein E